MKVLARPTAGKTVADCLTDPLLSLISALTAIAHIFLISQHFSLLPIATFPKFLTDPVDLQFNSLVQEGRKIELTWYISAPAKAADIPAPNQHSRCLHGCLG